MVRNAERIKQCINCSFERIKLLLPILAALGQRDNNAPAFLWPIGSFDKTPPNTENLYRIEVIEIFSNRSHELNGRNMHQKSHIGTGRIFQLIEILQTKTKHLQRSLTYERRKMHFGKPESDEAILYGIFKNLAIRFFSDAAANDWKFCRHLVIPPDARDFFNQVLFNIQVAPDRRRRHTVRTGSHFFYRAPKPL